MNSNFRKARCALVFVFVSLMGAPNSHLDAGSPSQPLAASRSLTFEERVAYQYAIEEVYWRHRIWPKENSTPKPSLDEVMSRGQIEKKVEDYLRDSQLLTRRSRRPITQDQLQAEMDRMAQNTNQPDILRELFAALNNDPFIIAECLARPILSERLAADLAVAAGVPPAARNLFVRDTAAFTGKNSAAYVLPQISLPLDCVDDTWTATTLTSAPDGRFLHTGVWTGSEMIVWGGDNAGFNFNTGGKYNPSTDSWTATSTTNAPDGRFVHTGVWTGSEVIIWGGYPAFNNGGRYDPSTNSWLAISTVNAPTGRYSHTAVWTGTEMIIWGGVFYDGNFHNLNTGGRYNPSTDTWTATSITSTPSARASHTAVWTGSRMIVWGGFGGADLNTGGRYNPNTDTWVATSMTSAPSARDSHTSVWTGSEMIIWGGYNNSSYENTGGKYNPSTDSWAATNTINAPSGRQYHTAVWTGSEMIIWGGEGLLNTGGRYNPSSDSWTATSITGAPAGRYYHTAVWTGTQMIVWGGENDNSNGLNTGGRYCAQPSAPIVQSAASRKTHGSAGNFAVNLPLSGTHGIECRSGSATNDYTMVVTFLANVSVNGSPQAAVTAGTGTVGSGGVSNGGMVTISGNVVTIPLTNVANAQTINVTLNSVNTSTNLTIPMSILIGDTNANGTVNAADVAQTKARLGQAVDATNFRSDLNANGTLNAADVSIVKSHLGTGLP
jgi:N-acetylneuraminic acid mutarotase